MGLANSGAVWSEPAGSGAAARATLGVIVDLGGGNYEITDSGTPAASLVSDGSGGYTIVVGTLTGTGTIIFIGGNAEIR